MAADDEQDGGILELTERLEDERELGESAPAPVQASPSAARRKSAGTQAAPTEPAPVAAPVDPILSDVSAAAARQSLSQLSSMLVRPQEGEANTLEGLVREMLRPMLKDWLEAQLPELVESLVKKEIDRIVGRLG